LLYALIKLFLSKTNFLLAKATYHFYLVALLLILTYFLILPLFRYIPIFHPKVTLLILFRFLIALLRNRVMILSFFVVLVKLSLFLFVILIIYLKIIAFLLLAFILAIEYLIRFFFGFPFYNSLFFLKKVLF
jgi:hypothetical protein